MPIRINEDEVVPLWVQITDSAGAGVTGEDPKVEIQRTSDDKWWDGAAWQATVQVIDVPPHDATNFPGYYEYLWTNDGEDTYRVHYTNVNTNGYGLEQMEVYSTQGDVKYQSLDINNPSGNAITLSNTAGEDILEQIWSAVAGRMQLENATPGTATQIEMQLYEYDNSTTSVKLNIKNPDGTGNTTQLDSTAMAGRNV